MEEHFQHLINLHITTLERTLYALNDYLGTQSVSPNIIFQNKIAIDNHISGIGRSIHQLTRDISKSAKSAIKSNNSIHNNYNKLNNVTDIVYPVDTFLNNISNKTTNNTINNSSKINLRNVKLKNPMKNTNDNTNTLDRWQILCLDEDNVKFLWNAFIKFNACYQRFNLHRSFKQWEKNSVMKRTRINESRKVFNDNEFHIIKNLINDDHEKYESSENIESFDYRKYIEQADLKIFQTIRNNNNNNNSNSNHNHNDTNIDLKDQNDYMKRYINQDIDDNNITSEYLAQQDEEEDKFNDIYDYNNEYEYEYSNSRRNSWDGGDRSFSPEVFDAGSGQQIFSLESDNMIKSIEDYIGSSSSIDNFDCNHDQDVGSYNNNISSTNYQNFSSLQSLKHTLFRYNRNELLDPLDESLNEAFELI